MQKKYSGLNELLQQDNEALNYFNSLPDFVQDAVRERESGVNSLLSLQDYAENLTRQDD